MRYNFTAVKREEFSSRHNFAKKTQTNVALYKS